MAVLCSVTAPQRIFPFMVLASKLLKNVQKKIVRKHFRIFSIVARKVLDDDDECCRGYCFLRNSFPCTIVSVLAACSWGRSIHIWIENMHCATVGMWYLQLFVTFIFAGLFATEVMLAYFVLLHFKLK